MAVFTTPFLILYLKPFIRSDLGQFFQRFNHTIMVRILIRVKCNQYRTWKFLTLIAGIDFLFNTAPADPAIHTAQVNFPRPAAFTSKVIFRNPGFFYQILQVVARCINEYFTRAAVQATIRNSVIHKHKIGMEHGAWSGEA